MGDFRPISLVGSMYKVVAKVLANRIKKVMASIMGENQMAFIKNRQILDSFVIAEEIIHKWRKGGEGSLLVKLDFEKAYDSVDHFFLNEMLVKMGFGLKWINWIKGCITTPKMSIFVNGSPTLPFEISWRILKVVSRQIQLAFERSSSEFWHGSGGVCKMSNQDLETLNHTFIHCVWSWKVWVQGLCWWGVEVSPNRDIKGWWKSWKGLCPVSTKVRIWELQFLAAIWTLWEIRNEVVFRGKDITVLKAVDMVKFRMVWWFKHFGSGSKDSIDILLLNLTERCVDSRKRKDQTAKAWIPPICNVLKFKFNDSALGNPGSAGIGGGGG
ncbi:hypothetical protein Ddye_018583 [Dipteronia dyeriana]|uniref:Reverse transcriptase domain-containing protein n=1 Tax=Dipteronia dyeriana TaxID=168575 RepID=A0AAD9UBM3_9ROSI|nr:hypothetical protein Ddye_018583 [Dipteronia dyeriana]